MSTNRLRPWKTYFRWLRRQPLVRPWALSAPIAVLLICLPLLRPLRHPDPRTISDDEQARLATVQAIVEHHTLAIDRTDFRGTQAVILRPDGHLYSDQSPVMSALLSGPYWVMHRYGVSFRADPVLAEYLLTLLGVTLPVAFAAGLLYRMGRIFELRRPQRAGLALAVVVASGWISYATVLSAGAAAAALVVMGTGCLVQAILTSRRAAVFTWLATGGLCVALAATYEPAAAVFLVLLVAMICAARWSFRHRVIGVGFYIAGALLPLLLYANLNRRVTGDLRPGFLHPEMQPLDTALKQTDDDQWVDTIESPGRMERIERAGGRVLLAIFGDHGLLTHFPILIVGLIGMSLVMHRHWPATTKVLATATVTGAALIVIVYAGSQARWDQAMFANRWFLVFLPLMLFWSGAWLRRPHRPTTWVIVSLLLGFSTFAAILGATDPEPRKGYDRYSVAGAFAHLVMPVSEIHHASLADDQ